MRKRDIPLYVILIISIIVIILVILNLKKEEQLSEQELLCIAENSELYTTSWCPHCKDQKALIQKNLDKYNLNLQDTFNSIVCDLDKESKQICEEKNIETIPAWIINNKSYVGLQSLTKLKELTGC